MTQEEKHLLLIDLCARLPHGVKVWYKYYPINITEKFATSIRLSDNKIALSSKFTKEGSWHPIEEAGEILIKHYLRPISSMTEEELIEARELGIYFAFEDNVRVFDGFGNVGAEEQLRALDWLNAHHFDYRGLIKKGLAIEAPKDMY